MAGTLARYSDATVSAEEDDPSAATDGIDCKMLTQAGVLLHTPSSLAAGTTLEIWVSSDAGTSWQQLTAETQTIDETASDYYGPYDVVGFDRFAAVLKNGSWSGSIKKRYTGGIS